MASLRDIREPRRLPRAYPGEAPLSEARRVPWITPDTVKAEDDHAIAFIYTADHELFGKAGLYHVEIIGKEPKLLARYGQMFGQARGAHTYRDKAEEFDLFARIGRVTINSTPTLVLSLWNKRPLCDKLLPGLLHKLRNKLPPGCYLSTEHGGTVPLSGLAEGVIREWEQPAPPKPRPFQNPDSVWSDEAIAFIYTSNGKMYYGAPGETHYTIIGKNRQLLRSRYDLEKYYFANGIPIEDGGIPITAKDLTKSDWKRIAETDAIARDVGMEKYGDLFGRISEGIELVCFWNKNLDDYTRLPECLSRLIDSGMLLQDAEVSTPVHGTVGIDELPGAQAKELDAEAAEKWQLHRELHLMRGGEKQAAMKKLGVGGQKPHPVQTALDKAGLRVPGQKWWAMQSEEVLREWGPAKKIPYINPDEIWFTDFNNTTFIFDNESQALYVPPDGDRLTHRDIIELNPELDKKYNGRSAGVDSGSLLGRIGEIPDMYHEVYPHTVGAIVISFWNKDQDHYDANLDACLAAIKRIGKLPADAYISTPLLRTVPISDVMGGKSETQEMSPGDNEKWELARNMHLMRGQEKRDAMKKLGVGGQKPHPIQTAMDKAGLRVPGQKWWAMQSEEILREWGESQPRPKYGYDVDPDHIYMEDENYVTFVYTDDGQYFEAGPPSTHATIMRKYKLAGPHGDRFDGMEAGFLMGRYGNIVYDGKPISDYGRSTKGGDFVDVVAFWNEEPSDYNNLVPCLKEIEKRGRLNPAAYVSTPVHGMVPLEDIMGGRAEAKTMSPEEHEKWELARNMHLMRGQEKRDAMKKLGVGGQKPHPMQTALDNAGLRVPGQKWWAPHSESLVREWEDEEEELEEPPQDRPAKLGYITPDNSYVNTDDYTTFIYDDGKLYAQEEVTHAQMLVGWQDLYNKYKESTGARNGWDMRLALVDTVLMGRVGTVHNRQFGDLHVIAFWNNSRDLYDRDLQGCLRDLGREGLIKPDSYVSIPFMGTVPIETVMGRGPKRDKAPTSRPHPMQTAMDYAGLRTPGQKWWAMQSEAIDREQQNQTYAYVNPDILYYQGYCHSAFIYEDNGRLHREYDATHADMIMNSDILAKKYGGPGGWIAADGVVTDRNRVLEYGHDLIGRVGIMDCRASNCPLPQELGQATVVSFWNRDRQIYDALLAPCLKVLGVMADQLVSTPVHGTVLASSLLGGVKAVSRDMTADENEKWELARRMHLMRGQEKRDAMKKLGVGGQKPHPMQTALDYAGLRQPGQKWWAMQSEGMDSSLEGKLSRTLESL